MSELTINTISELPCTKNKCILLPVCKAKTHIRCNELRRHTDNINHILKQRTDITDEIIKTSFQIVLETFPNIEAVLFEKPDIRIMDYSIRSDMDLRGIK